MSASLITPRLARAAATPRISAVQTILVVQGCYYLLLGLWSILDLDSFLSAEVVFVAVASAAGLTVLDVAHVMARVVSPVYLIDAAAQVALLLWWVWLGATKLSESGDDGG